MSESGLENTGNAINLYRLIWLRFIVISGEILALSYGVHVLNLKLPLPSLVVLLGTFGVINLLTLARFRSSIPVYNAELFFHLTLDVIALTILLYFTEGSNNPFAPLYLIPLTLTAATLPAIYTWSMVAITVFFYTGLFFFHVDIPEMHGAHEQAFRLHVVGMWWGFLLSALLIAGFMVRMSSTVKKQNQKIADLREQQLRQEQVLALGTLAAGAAHELGTPLSTMAILLNDIEPGMPVDKMELATLRQQVDRCRSILGSMSASAGTTRAVSGSQVRLDQHLQQLIETWKGTRTHVRATVTLDGPQPAPRIVVDHTLEQALLNIFDNAADASPDDVEISAQWNTQELTLDVADRGSGLSPDLLDKTGEAINSTKQNGLGLGLFLTYSTLERLGGTVHLLNREGGGVLCQIRLPLEALLIPESHDRKH